MLISSEHGGGGGGGGITVIPLDNDPHYFEAEHNAASQTFVNGGGSGNGIVDLEDYSSEGTVGFFQQVSQGGKHGLKALQNVICLTYLEIDPTPGQTFDLFAPYWYIRNNSTSWFTSYQDMISQTLSDVDDYTAFGPPQLIIPAGYEIYMYVLLRGLVADFTIDYADMELQVIGTF